MPLYLDEIWLNASPPENAKKLQAMFKDVLSGKEWIPAWRHAESWPVGLE